MSNPKVSVILTSYNKPQLVGKAIESVLQQTMDNFELFIMDDNSNTETQNVIRSYLYDSRIRFFCSNIPNEERYKKTRYAVLINQALTMSTGEYITYLTDDDIYHSRRLEIMHNFLDQHPSIQVVYTAQKIIELDRDFLEVNSQIRDIEGVLYNASEKVDHCSIMHRQGILQRIHEKYGSYWDEDRKNWGFGDAVFWKRMNTFSPFYPIRLLLDINFRTSLSYKNRHLGIPCFTPGEVFIPDGLLVKGTGPAVFYIDDQQRRLIKDYETFQFLKFEHSGVLEIPDPQLYHYQEGEVIDSNVFFNLVPNHLLIKPHNRQEVYLIQNRKKRFILNEQSFRLFGFQLERVITLPESTINSIESGPVLSSELENGMLLPYGILVKHSNIFYLVINNKLHPITNKWIMDKLNLSSKKAVEFPPNIFRKYSVGQELVYHW
jgi:spore maturation protein CgeD